MKSNAPNGGSSPRSPDPAGGFQEYRDTPAGVIANDDGNEFRERRGADDRGLACRSSPKKDNVYMRRGTRLRRQEPQTDLLQPVDGGTAVRTWSDPIEISGSDANI